jgi:hypothetical protein
MDENRKNIPRLLIDQMYLSITVIMYIAPKLSGFKYQQLEFLYI